MAEELDEATVRELVAAVSGQTGAAWALVRDDGVAPREALRMVGCPEHQVPAFLAAIQHRLGREVGPEPTSGIDRIRFRALANLIRGGN